MSNERRMTVEGGRVSVRTPGGMIDTFDFTSEKEARLRVAIVEQALTWIGTPFVNCGAVRGRNGAIDCAMLLTRSYVDAGALDEFDPRPYPPQWAQHNDRERFLEWIEDKLRGRIVETPRLGDCLVYRFGRAFSHGAIYLGNDEVVHAFQLSGICQISERTDTRLMYYSGNFLRPVRYYEVSR